MVSLAQLVEPPPLSAPAVSLVRAASLPADTTNGRWALEGITYQPEANAQAGLDDSCGGSGTPLAAIGTVTPSTDTSGGTLAADTYGYKVTALSYWGEGLPSAEATQITTGATSTVTLTWAAVPGADRYRVYGRTETGPWGLLATVSAPTLSWTDAGSVTPGAAPPAADTTGVYTYIPPPTVEWAPYAVQAYDQCSYLSSQGHDYAGRARRLIETATPKAVEREFWDGRLTQLLGLPNLYLTKAGSTVVNPTPGTAVSFARGLRLLEQALADTGFGAPGVIHCRPETLGDTNILLRRDGNLIRTLRDTIVVPGVGYSGLGPAGDNNETPAAGKTWMYATGLVEYRETPPELPDWTQSGPVPPSAVDRATNTVRLWARRTALASWDGQVHFACYTDLPA